MSEQSRLQKFESIFKILAVLIAAFWTFYIFYYQNYLLPRKEEDQASIKIDLKKVGEIRGMCYYTLRFDIANLSKHTLCMPLGYFNIVGNVIPGYDSRVAYGKNRQDSGLSIYHEWLYPECFQSDKIFGENSGILVGGEQSFNHLVIFPANRFDMLTIEYNVFFCKYENKTKIHWARDSENMIKGDAYFPDDTSYIMGNLHSQIYAVVNSTK